MTIITVTAPEGRLSVDARRELAVTLTDAVLVPEVGHMEPLARVGFQVYFRELALDSMAIGGHLLADASSQTDIMTIDVTVMDGHWPREVRAVVIRAVLKAMAHALGMEKPSATWWVQFRVIDEGSWGSRGDVLSLLSLLGSGAFTEDRAAAIRKALSS